MKVQSQTMLVNKEAYIHLRKVMYTERIGKELTEKQAASFERAFKYGAYDGYKKIYDRDLGGKTNGKWVSWNCAEMAAILDAAGLDYIMGKPEDVERISL